MVDAGGPEGDVWFLVGETEKPVVHRKGGGVGGWWCIEKEGVFVGGGA
jgi:hypothetical protein